MNTLTLLVACVALRCLSNVGELPTVTEVTCCVSDWRMLEKMGRTVGRCFEVLFWVCFGCFQFAGIMNSPLGIAVFILNRQF
ncbi:hypothetical protein BDV06DRAFT_182824 [Aspergillus oleicola]